MSGNIFWLASYPKSGNTWMRVLLTNYLRNTDTPADINSLDAGPIASARQIFDDNVGVEASDLTQDEIERYRPYVYEKISDEATEPLFLKVHDAYTETCEGKPIISKKATAGVLYLVRNPLDVSVSFAHHGASSIEKTVEKMGDPAYAFVDNPKRLHNQLRQRLLCWSGHVRSWVHEPDLPVMIVRYEDMVADTISTFTEVIRFCGLDDNPQRIARAVEFSGFRQLQSQEKEHGFGEKMPLAKSFFRSGSTGSWSSELNAELVTQLLSDHSEVMTELNYPTDQLTRMNTVSEDYQLKT